MLHYFLVVVGGVLVVAGIAKLYTAGHSDAVYKESEPLFGVSFRLIFVGVGALELVGGYICLAGKLLTPRVAIVGALGFSFAIYRTGLWLIDYKKPCSCLGELTDALRIDPGTADRLLVGIVTSMVLGSLYGLFITSPKYRNRIARLRQ